MCGRCSQRERSRAIAGLREALTKPATLAARQFNATLYAGHPYGNNSTAESLAAIGRDDLVDFHRRHYGANRAAVAIVGDLDRAAGLRERGRQMAAAAAVTPTGMSAVLGGDPDVVVAKAIAPYAPVASVVNLRSIFISAPSPMLAGPAPRPC